jgi:anti-anti-sigma regulatory factor
VAPMLRKLSWNSLGASAPTQFSWLSQHSLSGRDDTPNMIQPVAVPLPTRHAVVIDLIGDLDFTLGDIFAQTLDRLAFDGANDVVVNFNHVSVVHSDGLARVTSAIAQSRMDGCTISSLAKNRRIRNLLSGAHVPREEREVGFGGHRHVMIARHAEA